MRKGALVSIILILSLLAVACGDDGPEGVEVDDILPAAHWEEEYPDQYETYMLNLEMEGTTFGGSEPIDYPEEYPYLQTLYAGNGFANDYIRARGHPYSLEDVIHIDRPKPGASCLSCKTPEYVGLLNEHGSEAATMDFHEAAEIAVSPVSCFDCHGNEPGEILITRTHLEDALENVEEEMAMGNLVCAQCHVEYFLDSDTLEVVLPWENGINAWDIEEATIERGHVDWVHPQTGTELLKVQHPEFETYMGSIHDRVGVTCVDCHLPEMENDEGDIFHSHHVTSPLKYVEASCLGCHQETEEELIARTEAIQEDVYVKKNEIAELLVDLVEEFEEALEADELSDEEIEEARLYHQRAMWRWDFVFVENSTGFHNSEFAHTILDEARDYTEQALEIIRNR